uniref:WD_REPEATS_REGION domain-containing protein n=1 Tax=Mesocestoides corti TaxID=53468 RepID=A0A0R3UNZ7_MESCO
LTADMTAGTRTNPNWMISTFNRLFRRCHPFALFYAKYSFRPFKHHSGCVNALNFSHSGHLIASGSDDQRVAVTDFYSGKLITRFHSGHKLNVFQVCLIYYLLLLYN